MRAQIRTTTTAALDALTGAATAEQEAQALTALRDLFLTLRRHARRR